MRRGSTTTVFMPRWRASTISWARINDVELGLWPQSKKALAMRDIRRLNRRAEGKTEAGVFVPVADMSGRNPVRTAVEIEKPAKPALDIVHRGAAFCPLAQRHRFSPMLLADRQQSSRDVVEGFVPTDPLPPRIGVGLGPGALERIIQAVGIVNQLRRGLALDAHDTAVGMIVVRLQLCHPAVLHGGDGGAVGRAKGAVAAHFLNFD